MALGLAGAAEAVRGVLRCHPGINEKLVNVNFAELLGRSRRRKQTSFATDLRCFLRSDPSAGGSLCKWPLAWPERHPTLRFLAQALEILPPSGNRVTASKATTTVKNVTPRGADAREALDSQPQRCLAATPPDTTSEAPGRRQGATSDVQLGRGEVESSWRSWFTKSFGWIGPREETRLRPNQKAKQNISK